MDIEGFIPMLDKKSTTVEQIKKLDEERAKLLGSAKVDALARAEEAINELTALGFAYEIVEPARTTARKPRTARKASAPDHHPRGMCPICGWATNPAHDKRSHRSQTRKKPFTDAELAEKGMKMVA